MISIANIVKYRQSYSNVRQVIDVNVYAQIINSNNP